MNKHRVRSRGPLASAVGECLARSRPGSRAVAISVAAGLQCASLGTTAWAQGKEALEEIVVTATRREQTVQEIPFNISAISGDALAQANIYDSVEALRTVPGVTMLDRGYRNSGMANSIVIRGMNVDSAANGDVPLAAPPTVGVYVDDTALYGMFILKDIERVEVLRGPQGTLYGSGSLAGNVRYIMNKPDLGEFGGSVGLNMGATEGSDGYNFNPDVLLNIPLGETFAFRANAGMINNDGIVDYPNLYATDANGDPVVDGDVLTALPVYVRKEDVDDVDIKYARASVLFAPSESFEAQLSYQWQDDHVGGRRQVTSGTNFVTGGEYKDYEFGAVQKEPSDREVQLTALEIEMGFGFATLTSSTSYYSHTGKGISDNSGVYARNGWFYYYGSSPRPIAQAERFYDDTAFAQEFRLVSKGGEFVDWVAGLYYTDQRNHLGQNSYLVGYIPYLDAYPYPGCETQGWYCLAPYSTNQDFLFRRKESYEEIAGYGEVTFNFTDDLHLTLGGRYFDNSVDVNATVDVPIYASPGSPPGTSKETLDDNDFLFKANLAWDVAENSMLYATFSQGYRHAGANAVPTTGRYAENPAFLTFNADTVDNYEIGWKGITDRMNYSASVFYTDWKDPQLNTATSNWGFFAVINGESAQTRGFELELSGRLTEQFSYSFGYTYTDAELTKPVYQPAGRIGGAAGLYEDKVGADGGRLPGAAENVFNLMLSYEASISDRLSFNATLNGYYQSDTVNAIGNDRCLTTTVPDATDPNVLRCLDSARPTSIYYAPDSVYNRNYAEIDSFQIWNLSGTLSWESWSASLYMKNLFNEDGTTGVFTYLAGGANTTPEQRYYGNNSREYIALPRTIGLALQFKF